MTRSLLPLLGALSLLAALAPPAAALQDGGAASDGPAADTATGPASELPGYYRWYKKSGDQTVLPPEAERDGRMQQGELGAETVEFPLPDLELPDADGNLVGLRDWVGKKNLVLVNYRTWW